jgi:hypothetical protein
MNDHKNTIKDIIALWKMVGYTLVVAIVFGWILEHFLLFFGDLKF